MSLLQATYGCSWCRLNSFVRSLSSFNPHYNYGLSGKGKSRSRSPSSSSAPDVQGEVIFGHHPTVLALKARKRKTFHRIYVDSKFSAKENFSPLVQQIFECASQQNVPVQMLSKNVLDHLAGNRPHQGVCMDVDKLPVPEWRHQDLLARTSSTVPLWLLLHNLQDPMNFGAILRTAHYLGVDQVVLPSSDSCKLSPVVSKASSGALEVVNLLKLPNPATEVEFCQWWQSQGGVVVGTGAEMKEDGQSVLLEEFSVSHPTLVILGNEGIGLGKELEDCCDTVLTIQGHESTQLTERVQSLNVSVAAGILLHWIKASSMKIR